MEFIHKPVLLQETIDSLQINPDGVYVDCTAGGGGHSMAILNRLSDKGKLIAIDRDPDACLNLRQKFADYNNVIIINSNYKEIASVLSELHIPYADGVMADLGVSSYQLDTPERGFSFHADAPLDMRMSKSGLSAADVVNTYSERDLARILFTYGEEKFSKSIARRIVEERSKKPIETTLELAEIIKSGIPAKARREGGHPARKCFMGIRIETNREIEFLPESVENMFNVLKPMGGILSMITFHSLEDRVVKNKFREFTVGCICPKDFPVCTCNRTPRGELCFKSITPGEEELSDNPRARSARLRSIKRLK